MDELQFYPTPSALGRKAWALFQDRDFRLLLEPSAGNGDLLAGKPYDLRQDRIHLAEFDLSRHATLREKGQVVGVDFLEMGGLSLYSHMIMNPPFSQGAKHILHAWDGLWSGEIVAILNAETIRNPFSEERQRLAKIIAKHGNVQYARDAFLDHDTQRKTEVEVALVWLKKEPGKEYFTGDFLRGLKQEEDQQDVPDIQIGGQVALRGETLKNLVLAFDTAWQAELAAVQPRVRADYYRGLLGQKMAELVANTENGENRVAYLKNRERSQHVQAALAETYQDLKERAWTAVLMATDTDKYLTRKAVDRIKAEFAHISRLEFTLPNIFGFLQGLAESQGDIHLDICMDLFDRITRAGSENMAFYKPWKSNEKHRLGMKIRAKRFILGGFSLDGWRRDIGWTAMQSLKDLDRAFAILDGKPEPEKPLVALFDVDTNEWDQLRHGARLSCSYFEIRYYSGIGSIHFYPTRPDLIDRLNIVVGRKREWVPEQPVEDFQTQYDDAEKINAVLRKDHAKVVASLGCHYGRDENEAKLADALEATLADMGYPTEWNAVEDHSAEMPMVPLLQGPAGQCALF